MIVNFSHAALPIVVVLELYFLDALISSDIFSNFNDVDCILYIMYVVKLEDRYEKVCQR